MAVRQARAAALGSCLARLTALTRLDIRMNCLQHVMLYPVHAGKTELLVSCQIAKLRLEGRPEEAAALEGAVAAEWRALVAAARCMPKLKELCCPVIANVADLASLTALTHLAVGALVMPKRAAPPAEAADCASAAAATTDAERQQQQDGNTPLGVCHLPPLLQKLTSNAPLPLPIAAALKRSLPHASAADGDAAAAAAAQTPPIPPAPALIACHMAWHRDKFQCWALDFSAPAYPVDEGGRNQYLDGDGRLTAQAVTDMHSAISNLKSVFGPSLSSPPLTSPGPATTASSLPSRRSSLYLVLCSSTTSGGVRALPPSDEDEQDGVGGGDGTHWGSWLGASVSDLSPMLRGLKLSGFALSPRDMLSLGRSLQGIKILMLHGCSYPLPSLPLLGGLRALEELHLRADDWLAAFPGGGNGGGGGGEEGGALQEQLRPADLEAAFLGLMAPLRSSMDGGEGEEDGEGGGRAGGGGGSIGKLAAAAAAAVPLPGLRLLNIECCIPEDVDWLEEVLHSVRVEVEELRPVSASLDIRCMDD